MAKVAQTPPMGWNSWDCYGASVTEDEVKGNADYMAKHLKPYGWEYVVVDIQWYEPSADGSRYNPFTPLDMDQHGRLIPSVNRFPSAAGGKGFKPLADYLHDLGLKFGIHILRGIPRQAVHANMPIMGTSAHAKDIASNTICPWNTDMYGVDASKEGAQAYYNSLFNLYAEWGVDFVKVDDISYSDYHDYHRGEIELIRNAIDQCGREMVLSLSPGPAPIEQAGHIKQHANMWRITADFWDRWEDLLDMFDRAALWQGHASPGHWPDADMLPLGHIAIRSSEHGEGDRWTRFTKDEQVTMLTLWCIARSPLMLGGELRDNDEWTLSLLTNEEVLRVLSHSHSNQCLFRKGEQAAWKAIGENGSTYLALFNLGETPVKIEVPLHDLDIKGKASVRNLWALSDIGIVDSIVAASVQSHGAILLKMTEI